VFSNRVWRSRQKKVLLSSPVVLIAAGVALAFVIKGTTSPKNSAASKPVLPAQGQRAWNLSLQPEAFKLSRLLGQRFSSRQRHQSIVSGTLRIGTDQRLVNLVRRQTDDGERIEITVPGFPGLLTWSAGEGPLSSGGRAGGSDRELIERLVFDSPDQFVLAQLRGASYFTVARNVRPAGAGDNYSGPLWNIIRVNDPDTEESRRPQSRWRLYYLNATTGLIDKIESEVQGQRIVAEISGWTEISGEKVPTQIRWVRHGQTLMEYRLVAFSNLEARSDT